MKKIIILAILLTTNIMAENLSMCSEIAHNLIDNFANCKYNGEKTWSSGSRTQSFLCSNGEVEVCNATGCMTIIYKTGKSKRILYISEINKICSCMIYDEYNVMTLQGFVPHFKNDFINNYNYFKNSMQKTVKKKEPLSDIGRPAGYYDELERKKAAVKTNDSEADRKIALIMEKYK